MKPQFLIPEMTIQEAGTGPTIEVSNTAGQLLQLTMGITRIVEQEALEVSIWGSADGQEWRQLASFPQKFYCGTYSIFLDLSQSPEINFVRAQWKVNRWGRGSLKPLFGFYLAVQPAELVIHAHA